MRPPLLVFFITVTAISFSFLGKLSLNSPLDKNKKELLGKQLKAVIDNSTLRNASTAVSVDIYTPSGLPSQSYVPQKNVYQAEAPYRDIHSRYRLLFDKNQKAFEEYSSMSHGYLDGDEVSTPVSLDPTEVRGIQLDLLETTDVKHSSFLK